jgi:hypothetical protein
MIEYIATYYLGFAGGVVFTLAVQKIIKIMQKNKEDTK